MKRIDLLLKYIKGKSVLDIGCIEHTWKNYKDKNWIHNDIRKYSKEVLGLDYLKEDAKKLRKLGYNIIYGDAQNFNLKKKFDVIIAGEIIEHISNVGNFLDSSKKHMDKESKLIISTPNAFCLGNVLRILKLIFNLETNDNLEHTHWYDKQTLVQVLKRHGYKIEKITTSSPERYGKIIDLIIPNNLKSKLFVVAKLK